MHKLSKEEEDKIITQFTEDFDLAYTAEQDNRVEMVDDLRFAALDQWDEEAKKARANRPMLTLDRIGQSIRKVIGGMRINMPSIKVDPVDNGADKETSDVLEDLIRQIEQSSNARNAYLNAAKSQVKCGYGVWRVNAKTNSDDVFDQDLVIMPIKNPFTIYFDPDATMPQKQDGRFCIASENISREAFEEKYGEEAVSSIPNHGIGESRERWYSPDSIRIGEYFLKKKKKQNLTLLSNGMTVKSEDVTDEEIEAYVEQGINPVKTRDVEVDEIHWYKLTAFKVLEHRVWGGKFFPLIPVYGEEDNIEGETLHRGIVRAAKDAQRMYNYWNSAAAETISLQPKAPWIVTKDQIKNSKQYWNRANVDNLPYLPYEPDGKAPPPQRIAPPTFQAGFIQQSQVAANDIQQTTGVFDASTGALPEQRSGRAVIALQNEADLGTSLYQDNLASAVEHTGRVLIDLIPTYYDSERVIRLRGEDDSIKFAEINKAILTPDGKKIVNDLTRGKYDVRVGVGPGFKTRRMEAATSMVELAKVFPQVLQVAGDLVAKNLDWPGADEMAARLKKLLPPGIAEPDEDNPEAQQQAQLAQQQQQQLQQIQQAQLELEMTEKSVNIENKQADTAKKLSEAQQNEIENAVQIAEIANEQQNTQLMVAALQEAVALMQDSTVGAPAGF